ncbi:MAG: (d)CMP kinase [Gammaproteobacteria bacterium]|nr:(d)CMP kinase [Gammaproteobacteria bacterium]
MAGPDSTATVPVITIDGPSGSGKGTVAAKVAAATGYTLLDSGAVYRAAALRVLLQQVDADSEPAVVQCIESMQAEFEPGTDGVRVWLDGTDVTAELRSETTAAMASRIAAVPAVREALMQTQRDFRRPPGLVADGRDMGTVVFPDARHKIFLTASVAERARRRYNQLNKKELQVTMESLLQEIELRDQRDSTRSVAPLIPAKEALVIDSTGIGIDQVVEKILQNVRGNP